MTHATPEIGAPELRGVLDRLGIPLDPAAVLGVWPQSAGGLEIHLSPATFWRVVGRRGCAVTSTEHGDLLFPYGHRFTEADVAFVTFSVAPVLPPGMVTPGFALRLT